MEEWRRQLIPQSYHFITGSRYFFFGWYQLSFACALLSSCTIPWGPAHIWHVAMATAVLENVHVSHDVINYRHRFPLHLSEEDRDADRLGGEEKGKMMFMRKS